MPTLKSFGSTFIFLYQTVFNFEYYRAIQFACILYILLQFLHVLSNRHTRTVYVVCL